MNRDSWYPVPPNLPIGPMFPENERKAAQQRVVIKRAIRRALKAAGIKGVEIR